MRPFPFLTGAIPRGTRTAGWMAPRAESRTLRGGCCAAGPLGPKGVPLLEGCGELLGGEILGVGDHCVVCCVCGSAAGGAVARASLQSGGFVAVGGGPRCPVRVACFKDREIPQKKILFFAS